MNIAIVTHFHANVTLVAWYVVVKKEAYAVVNASVIQVGLDQLVSAEQPTIHVSRRLIEKVEGSAVAEDNVSAESASAIEMTSVVISVALFAKTVV